jgi:hypothetical protein
MMTAANGDLLFGVYTTLGEFDAAGNLIIHGTYELDGRHGAVRRRHRPAATSTQSDSSRPACRSTAASPGPSTTRPPCPLPFEVQPSKQNLQSGGPT